PVPPDLQIGEHRVGVDGLQHHVRRDRVRVAGDHASFGSLAGPVGVVEGNQLQVFSRGHGGGYRRSQVPTGPGHGYSYHFDVSSTNASSNTCNVTATSSSVWAAHTNHGSRASGHGMTPRRIIP